jgi:type IV secretion system protein VirD4
MENPLLDFLENSMRKFGMGLVRKVTFMSFKTRLVLGAALVSFFFLPFFLWLVLVGVAIYFAFFRNKGKAQAEEDLDILGNARWARFEDLVIGLGTPQRPQSCLLTWEPEDKSQILLGKVMTPSSNKDKKKQPLEENYIISTNEGHVLTIAQTGAGKGTNVVIPNVLWYGHSIIVLDPKGENFIKTHFFRENHKGQEICLIDPFGEVAREVGAIITRLQGTNHPQVDEATRYFKELQTRTSTYGQYLKGFNPLQVIEDLLEKQDYDQIIDEANVIADMIVVTTPNDKDPHWNEKAKSFIRGFIMAITFAEMCQEDRKTYPLTLVAVKDLLEDTFSSTERMNKFMKMCKDQENLKSVASTIGMIAENERGSVLSTILRHLDFLNSKNVKDSLTRNDFQLDDIRVHPKTIYLVLPANKISSYNRLARLWISSIKSSLERINDGFREKRPVLFMLDEVAQLGRMEPLVSAISLSRSYGLKLWMIFQDVAQMKVAYPNEEWRTFFSNTKAQQFFGISSTDTDTCKFVSDAAGQTTVSFATQSYSEGTNRGSSSNYGYSSGSGQGSSSSGGGSSSGTSQTYSINQQVQARPLVQPNEVSQITIDHILIFGVTKFPIMAQQMPYFRSSLFGNRYPVQLDAGLKL